MTKLVVAFRNFAKSAQKSNSVVAASGKNVIPRSVRVSKSQRESVRVSERQ